MFCFYSFFLAFFLVPVSAAVDGLSATGARIHTHIRADNNQSGRADPHRTSNGGVQRPSTVIHQQQQQDYPRERAAGGDSDETSLPPCAEAAVAATDQNSGRVYVCVCVCDKR